MPIALRSQQERRGVDGAGRDDEEGGFDADRLAVALDVGRNHARAGWVGMKAGGAAVRLERSKSIGRR